MVQYYLGDLIVSYLDPLVAKVLDPLIAFTDSKGSR